MLIENPTLVVLNIVTLSVIFFSSNLLVLRSYKRQTYLPLATCLLAIGVIICQPTLTVLAPNLKPIALIISLPALLLIAPSFWFYVSALTSESPWQFKRKLLPHLAPFAIGTLVTVITILLPSEIRHALLVEGDESVLRESPAFLSYLLYGLVFAAFFMILGWIVQSGYYFFKIVKRLHIYREHLKDLFASTENREIRWLSWLLLAVGGVWLVTAISLILDNLFFPFQLDPVLSNLVTLIMIWSIAVWGLRQKPGLEDIYHSNDDAAEVLNPNEPNNGQEKYQRSALSQQQSSAIAVKIESTMETEKLYLDASLSLQKLAKKINTSPNYISQTLNETLGMNFFDYVNKYRVEAAKYLLTNSKDTVLDIAMEVGFNAKSSFYTAFKKEMQQTPNQYRKNNQSSR